MVANNYVPERGDVVWISFDPAIGHEQRGRRPALVLSQKAYNELTSLFIVCPATSKVKGYPYEVSLKGKKIKGVALVDQMRSYDWRGRKAKLIERVSETVMIDAILKANTLLKM